MTASQPFPVYDFRTDVRNVVVCPEIRSRFLRMEPGEVGPFHSHDVGHEVFLILSGRCEFLIDGHREVLGPGQMCVARPGQLHEVRVVGDESMTMYLSVTPHLEPTHTFWDEKGNRLPPWPGSWAAAGLADQPAPTDPLPTLAERHAAAARALADAAAAHAAAQDELVAAIEAAVARNDVASAKAAVDSGCDQMRQTYAQVQALMAAWNDLALRAGQVADEV